MLLGENSGSIPFEQSMHSISESQYKTLFTSTENPFSKGEEEFSMHRERTELKPLVEDSLFSNIFSMSNMKSEGN